MVRHVFLSNDLSPSNVFFFPVICSFSALFSFFFGTPLSFFFFFLDIRSSSAWFLSFFSLLLTSFFLLLVFLVLDGSHASFTTSPMRSNRSLGCVSKKE